MQFYTTFILPLFSHECRCAKASQCVIPPGVLLGLTQDADQEYMCHIIHALKYIAGVVMSVQLTKDLLVRHMHSFSSRRQENPRRRCIMGPFPTLYDRQDQPICAVCNILHQMYGSKCHNVSPRHRDSSRCCAGGHVVLGLQISSTVTKLGTLTLRFLLPCANGQACRRQVTHFCNHKMLDGWIILTTLYSSNLPYSPPVTNVTGTDTFLWF